MTPNLLLDVYKFSSVTFSRWSSMDALQVVMVTISTRDMLKGITCYSRGRQINQSSKVNGYLWASKDLGGHCARIDI